MNGWIFFDEGTGDEGWYKSVFPKLKKKKEHLKFYYQNHWACANHNGGHAILLGAQWSFASDYGFRKEFSFDICLLGFAFGFGILPGEVKL